VKVHFTVNHTDADVDVEGPESLLFVLREQLSLPGAKNACEQGECGSCTVVLDGDVVCSCLVMAAALEGSTVETVEGLAGDGGLHPVQRAFVDAHAVQCGFCTPGFMVAAAKFLADNPSPSGTDIREALAGNLCRCTGYGAILRAMARAVADPAP
jgi:carbon-monoxide dehydrogenase small subunit